MDNLQFTNGQSMAFTALVIIAACLFSSFHHIDMCCLSRASCHLVSMSVLFIIFAVDVTSIVVEGKLSLVLHEDQRKKTLM